MRFLGLELGDKAPDAKTIWLFKDTLTKAAVMDKLFKMFYNQLESRGIITHTGTIVDAAFADAPRQRSSRDENKKVKNGEIPDWAYKSCLQYVQILCSEKEAGDYGITMSICGKIPQI